MNHHRCQIVFAVCVALGPMSFAAAAPPVDLSELVPLTTLGEQKYQGFVGGLYPDGQNQPTGLYADSLRRVCSQIRPLDAEGKPNAEGRIVVAGVGASVCRQIFAKLETLAPSSPGISKSVVFVNCALGGQDVNKIADPAERYWNAAKATLTARGLTPAQVQVVWYQSDDLRDMGDDFPGRPQRFKENLVKQMHLIKQHFPNAQICYHSARHTTAFIPKDKGETKHSEPRPYHVGWAVKWLLEDQIRGNAELRFEGRSAPSPLIAWSTYFWTSGDKPRQDGYRWSAEDVVKDGVHLSPTAQTRVANELLTFFATDSCARNWFAGNGSNAVAPVPTPSTESPATPKKVAKKEAGPDEPAWIINGSNKLPKLKRLVGERDFLRVVVRNLDGKAVAEIDDVLKHHTDLNKLVGPGQYRLEFFDRERKPIELSQPVGEILRLK